MLIKYNSHKIISFLYNKIYNFIIYICKSMLYSLHTNMCDNLAVVLEILNHYLGWYHWMLMQHHTFMNKVVILLEYFLIIRKHYDINSWDTITIFKTKKQCFTMRDGWVMSKLSLIGMNQHIHTFKLTIAIYVWTHSCI